MNIKYLLLSFINKQLLPLGRIGGYSIPYFIKGKLFTKSDLIERINNIPEAKYYLPETVKWEFLSRDFLINVRII